MSELESNIYMNPNDWSDANPRVVELFQEKNYDLFLLEHISKEKKRRKVPYCFDIEVETPETASQLPWIKGLFTMASTTQFPNYNVSQTVCSDAINPEIIARIKPDYFVFKNSPKVDPTVFDASLISEILGVYANWTAAFFSKEYSPKIDGKLDETSLLYWNILYNE